jgi:hypothetical protein
MSDHYFDPQSGTASGSDTNSGVGSAGHHVRPVLDDKFNQDKVANYIHDALNKSDANGDGILSRGELEEARKHDKTPADEKASEFIAKHFGALSVMNTDTKSREGGITHQDALNLHGDYALQYARTSFIEKYCELGCNKRSAKGFSRYFDKTFTPQVKTMLDDLKRSSSK